MSHRESTRYEKHGRAVPPGHTIWRWVLSAWFSLAGSLPCNWWTSCLLWVSEARSELYLTPHRLELWICSFSSWISFRLLFYLFPLQKWTYISGSRKKWNVKGWWSHKKKSKRNGHRWWTLPMSPTKISQVLQYGSKFPLKWRGNDRSTFFR